MAKIFWSLLHGARESRSLVRCEKNREANERNEERMNFFIYTVAGALAAKTSSAQGGGHEISLYSWLYGEPPPIFLIRTPRGTFLRGPRARRRAHSETMPRECVCVKKRVFYFLVLQKENNDARN
jgi:hypothetical protein